MTGRILITQEKSVLTYPRSQLRRVSDGKAIVFNRRDQRPTVGDTVAVGEKQFKVTDLICKLGNVPSSATVERA